MFGILPEVRISLLKCLKVTLYFLNRFLCRIGLLKENLFAISKNFFDALSKISQERGFIKKFKIIAHILVIFIIISFDNPPSL